MHHRQLGKKSHPNIKADNIKALYKFALSYTSGHVYPLLKMMEYLLSCPYDGDDSFNDSHFRRILCGNKFYVSDAFKKNKNQEIIDFVPSISSKKI
jgi:hypothetical protein